MYVFGPVSSYSSEDYKVSGFKAEKKKCVCADVWEGLEPGNRSSSSMAKAVWPLPRRKSKAKQFPRGDWTPGLQPDEFDGLHPGAWITRREYIPNRHAVFSCPKYRLVIIAGFHTRYSPGWLLRTASRRKAIICPAPVSLCIFVSP